jgi:ABC-type nitrate/sulfonate/bicarbonate transport system permease component
MKRINHSEEIRYEKWAHLLVIFVLLSVWEGLVATGVVSALFFPAPTTILVQTYKLLLNGVLLVHLKATLGRIVISMLFGGLAGLLLGAAMGWSKRLRFLADPLIAALHPIPKISILPLVMIIFGIGETSKVIVVAISVFFPMLINTMVGVHQISPLYYEVAKNYGATPRKLFSRVILPGSLPMVMSGVRLAINTALMVTIAVELVAAQEGLGAMIWLSWEILRTVDLYVSLLVITILGVLSNLVIHYCTRWLAPWSSLQEK